MHETSLVAELVDECGRRAAGRQVMVVRVRHAASIDADGLRELFRALTANGPLERAALEAESVPVTLDCSECGYSGGLDAEHVYGHVRICPGCSAVNDDTLSAELELLEVVTSV